MKSIMAGLKRKKAAAAAEDRISWLPDSLLLEIITRLDDYSTKEVIKTTTPISKRFQHLWTRLPNLVFTNKDDHPEYLTYMDNVLNQCPPSDVNLTKFKLQMLTGEPRLQLNRWLRYAITRNVQEIDLRITDSSKFAVCDDELFFNNSCLVSLKVSSCVFDPPNGVIRWDKLKCLCIDRWASLDGVLLAKMLSGSPCLETFELTCCHFEWSIPVSFFGNFGVVERLSCDLETCRSFRYNKFIGDESKTPISMKLSRCVSNPSNGGAIRWDKLKYLCIDGCTYLDEDLLGEMFSGSPCLETFELTCPRYCGIPMSLFGKFGVLESLSCDLETYVRYRYDEFLGDEDDHESKTPISMKLSRCVSNPPNSVIRWDQVKFLCIDKVKYDGYSIGKILSESPCLETLQLNDYGLDGIDVASKSVKNLVLSYSGNNLCTDYLIAINAPYILSLTIKGDVYLEELLLENVASLVKADLDYGINYHFAKEPGRGRHDVEEELLRGLLSSLCHVNEIALGDRCCLWALSRLEANGFQFRKGSDLISRGDHLGSYRIFSLTHES